MLLETLSNVFTPARVTNATDSSFPTRSPQVAQPSGTGTAAAQANAAAVFNLRGDPNPGQLVQNGLLLVAYGTGADETTFNVRVIGWRQVGGGSQTPTLLWVPVTLVELACINGGVVGVAGTTIPATMNFADTMTLTTGNANVSVDIVSPAVETQIAHAMLDVKGFQLVEVAFSVGTATDANALIALL